MNGRVIPFFLLIAFLACKKGPEKAVRSEGEGIYNVNIIQKNYENKSFELFAREIEFHGDTTKAKDVKIVFFEPSGDTSSILFANKGWYVEKSGNVGASGNVKVFSVKGDSLFTDTLFYNDSSRSINAPSKVVIYRRGEKIEGSGLVSDVGFKNVVIGGKVIGERRKND